MRIVIDATAAVSGGKLYLENLIELLSKSGSKHEFIIIHAGDLDQLASSLRGQNVDFYRIDVLADIRIPGIPPGLWRMFWRRFFLSRLITRFQADLIFSNSGFAPVGKKRNYKVLIALHNSMPLREELIAEERSLVLRLRLIWLRRMIHRSLMNCDGAIVFSNDTERTIREKFGDLKVKPKVIYHGIDWKPVAINIEAPKYLKLDRPYLLYVSQFHRYKNVIRLLKAFAQVTANNQDLTLVLIGEKADPLYWNEVESTIESLNIGNRIISLGSCPREELLSIYQNALAFIHPSLAETCSFPLLEALAVGLPIAAARMSALPEIAADAALYFNPYEVQEIASVLKMLIENDDLRQDLSERALKRASVFSWQTTAIKTMNIIEEIALIDK
jgi:glycosyltransferase involved in cell wall biosynthesis